MKKTQNLSLECILTDEEKLSYSKEIAQSVADKRNAEATMKTFAAQQKATITEHDASINLLSQKLSTGIEFRDVDCDIERDFENNKKRWIRKDTKQIARESLIPTEERQEQLELDEREKDIEKLKEMNDDSKKIEAASEDHPDFKVKEEEQPQQDYPKGEE